MNKAERSMSNNWVHYWKNQNIFREKSFKKSMEYFIDNSKRILNYNQNDVVLDIGSGPCYLAYCLKDKVSEIHCAEISEQLLDRGKSLLKNTTNVYFHYLDDNYTNFIFFKKEKFSIIICKGVIAYYDNLKEVETLIENVRRIAKPGARFLITDIPFVGSFISDITGIIKGGIKAKLFVESIKFFYRAIFSEYYKVRSSKGILTVTPEQLTKIILEHNLHAEILEDNLTYNFNRKHLIIYF
jgi:ubiquinone/menaquinone biosynthesis C-methylase UbiE